MSLPCVLVLISSYINEVDFNGLAIVRLPMQGKTVRRTFALIYRYASAGINVPLIFAQILAPQPA